MKSAAEIALETRNTILDSYSLDHEMIGFIPTEHLYEMLNEIYDMPETAKAHRWVGFIQGVLAAEGLATIDELSRICRP